MILVMVCGLWSILLKIIVIIVFSFPSFTSICLPNYHSLFYFPSKIPCPSVLQCSHPPSIFFPYPAYFLLVSHAACPSSLFCNQLFQSPTSYSHFELFPHLLSSSLISSAILLSPSYFPCVCLFSLFSCIASFSYSEFPDGISSFMLLVQMMGNYGSCLEHGHENISHMSGRGEGLQILVSPLCLHPPPAEGMVSFRKVSTLSFLSLHQ